MIVVKNKNIWSAFQTPNNIVVVTTNQEVNSKGELVMGAGIALEAKHRVPGLAKDMGELANFNKMYSYKQFDKWGIACLQTKLHWKNPTPIKLLCGSIDVFNEWVLKNKATQFHCPLFGCSNGGLNWERDVLPMVTKLPDNVIFYDNRP